MDRLVVFPAILVAICLTQGNFAAVLQKPMISCPLLYCMSPGSCTQFKTTYLNIRGQQCMGCPVCADAKDSAKRSLIPIDLPHLMPCPMVDCAFPGTCTKFKATYYEMNGRQCPGCSVCAEQIQKRDLPPVTEEIMDCPFIDCAFPGSCLNGHIETSYMTWHGKKCAACSRCVESNIPIYLGKRAAIPIDLGHLCPIVDCAFPGVCAQYKPSYFNINGRQCPGCSVCADQLTPIKREILPGSLIHLNMCPMVLCAAPGPCDVDYKISKTHWNGKECPGCSYCPTNSASKREVLSSVRPTECPMVKCAVPRCDRPRMSYGVFRGVRCPMCPFCPDSTGPVEREVVNPGVILDICPIPMCAAPGPCDHAYNMSYISVHDKKCPMCAYCAKDKRAFVPIDPGRFHKCPIVDCAYSGDCATKTFRPSYYNINGRQCPGCNVCADQLTPIKREILPGSLILNMCPMVLCASPGPCDVDYKISKTHWNGKECPGCSYCPTNSASKREVLSSVRPTECPMVKCAVPRCDRPRMSYGVFRGVRCPMCPFCPDSSGPVEREVVNPGVILDICPIPMCAAPGPCDHAYNMSYISVHDKKCPMCAYCAKDKRETVPEIAEFRCPQLPCPPLFHCDEVVPTTYIYEGHKCPGCFKCIINGSQEIPREIIPKPRCLELPCLPPVNCDKLIPTTYTYQGHTCPSCPKCVRNSQLFQNRRRETATLDKFQCPRFPCPLLVDCKESAPTTIVIDGHTCPGCRKCVKFVSDPLLLG